MLTLQWSYELVNLKSLTVHGKCKPSEARQHTLTAPPMRVSIRQTAGWTDGEIRETALFIESPLCGWCSSNLRMGWFLPFLWLWLNTLTCSNMGHLEFLMVNLLFGEHTRAFEEVKAQGTGDSHQDICTAAHNFTQVYLFYVRKVTFQRIYNHQEKNHPVLVLEWMWRIFLFLFLLCQLLPTCFVFKERPWYFPIFFFMSKIPSRAQNQQCGSGSHKFLSTLK